MRKAQLLILLIFCSYPLFSSGQSEGSGDAPSAGRPSVFVANYPLYYAVEKIAGPSVDILWLFPEGDDPAFWEPTRDNLAVLQEADLLFFNGAGYEKWADAAFLDPGRIIQTSRSLKELFLESGQGAMHSHSGGAEHSHGGTAFTLWLDLAQYEVQCNAVLRGLVRLFPAEEEKMAEAHGVLIRELRELDKEFLAVGKALEGVPFLASHPVYQYFSRAYGVEAKAFLWEPDVFPSEDDWSALAARLEDLQDLRPEAPAYMIWEDAPLDETRLHLEKQGVEILVINPGFARENGFEDFLSLLRGNLDELKRVAAMEGGLF